jgi:EPS-associated MarR family transcriptional regulator
LNDQPSPKSGSDGRLNDEAHLKLLRLLETNPRMAQRELADALGISVGKANYCLKALLEKGLIKVSNFRRSDNKLAYAYLLTPAGVAAKASLTVRFLRRKTAEYEALKDEIAALEWEVARQGEPEEEVRESK